jgi:hypothetical protein
MTATKTTLTTPGLTGNAKPNVDEQPPVSTVKVESAPPASVFSTPPDAQARQPKIPQEDWLSKLIPDDAPGLATGAVARQAAPEGEFATATNRPAAVVVVDFSHNDFATMFDGHNDSDSIIWDPHAEVVASFPGFSVAQDVVDAPAVENMFVREGDAMMHEEANMSSMLANDALQFLQVSDPTNVQHQQEIRSPKTEGGPALRSNGPPMSTVLVCKVTATTTTATTTSQSSSSSSSNSSASSNNFNPSQQMVAKEGRDDYDEDGVSDMETDGVEDAAANAPGRAPMLPNGGGGRTPPRPTQLEPTHVPPTEPAREVRERRLSFSSLQMMLDKHSTHRNNGAAADNESLEDFFRDDDSLLNDDEEIAPGPVMDGREDTYSFIGADYSFGADRSLISLLP